MTLRLGVLFAIFFSIWACSSEGKVEKPPAAVPGRVASVVQKNVPVSIRVIGNVEAYLVVSIRSLVAGAITEVNFREGQEVQRGISSS